MGDASCGSSRNVHNLALSGPPRWCGAGYVLAHSVGTLTRTRVITVASNPRFAEARG